MQQKNRSLCQGILWFEHKRTILQNCNGSTELHSSINIYSDVLACLKTHSRECLLCNYHGSSEMHAIKNFEKNHEFTTTIIFCYKATSCILADVDCSTCNIDTQFTNPVYINTYFSEPDWFF